MKTVNRFGFLLMFVVLLSGCEFFKKDKAAEKIQKTAESGVVKLAQEGTGDVLLSLDGKPVLRESDFLNSIKQMLQANPYFRGASIDMLPVAIKRKFFDELIKQELILAWADKNDVVSDPEFIKSKEEVLKLVNRSLILQYFEKKVLGKISVSDKDVENEFNKNKDKYIKVAGGVLVYSVKFDDGKADDFYEKVKKEKDADKFVEIAKSEKGFEDFGRVSLAAARGMDRIPKVIKDKVLGFKNLPVVEKIKVGKSVYVVHVSDKKEDVYFELDEIKPQIEMMLKNNKFKDKLDGEIKSLRKQFTLDVNEDYFKKLEEQQAQPVEPAKTEKTSSVVA